MFYFCWTEVYFVESLVPSISDFTCLFPWVSKLGQILCYLCSFVPCMQQSPESALVAGIWNRTQISLLWGEQDTNSDWQPPGPGCCCHYSLMFPGNEARPKSFKFHTLISITFHNIFKMISIKIKWTCTPIFLAQLISCAITNHSSGCDCSCHCCCWHQHQHCRQKLTSSSVPM